MIRTGIRPIFNFVTSGGLPDSERNQRLAKRWLKWTRRQADLRGQLSFDRLQRLAYDEFFASGSFFVKRNWDASRLAQGLSPLQVQLLDRDHIDTTVNMINEDGTVTRRGIVYSPQDKVLGYWLHDTLPTDRSTFRPASQSRYIPAAWVIHVYDPERISQREGVPETSSAALTAGDLEDFQGYALQQAMVGAQDRGKLVGADPGAEKGLMSSPMPGGGGYTPPAQKRWPTYFDESGKLVGEDTYINMGGPRITVLPKGMFHEPSPQTPNANLPQFSDHCSRRIAGPSGISYEMSTGDVSKTSFAGIMATQQLSGVDFECAQHFFIEAFCEKIMEWWLEAEYLTGPQNIRRDLTMMGIDADEVYDAITWQYNGEQTLNPYQSAKAARERIDLGMSSHRSEAATVGENFDENISQQNAEYELLIERESKRLKLARLRKQLEDIDDPEMV